MSKVLDYQYSNEIISTLGSRNKQSGEANDCFVRALAVAAEVAYDHAHEFAATKFGRQKRQGTQAVLLTAKQLQSEIQVVGAKKVNFSVLPQPRVKNLYHPDGEPKWRQKTVKSFIKDNPVGTYIVCVSRHAFTVRDGMLIDNAGEEFRPTRKVEGAFQVKVQPREIQLKMEL